MDHGRIVLGTEILSDFQRASRIEWLETNGQGGYASSSIVGTNTRRYHGLLVANGETLSDRQVVVSRLDETLIVRNERFELACNQYDAVLAPQGYLFLEQFERGIFTRFTYRAGRFHLTKTVGMLRNENTTVVRYEFRAAPEDAVLSLTPFFALRSYHSLRQMNAGVDSSFTFEAGVWRAKPFQESPRVSIRISEARFDPNPLWYYRALYERDRERGFDCFEDLFSFGAFVVPVCAGTQVVVSVSTEPRLERNPLERMQEEAQRREALTIVDSSANEGSLLARAADQCLVRLRDGRASVVAGYPWFTDWGRDTMISLPALCLATGRIDQAKEILLGFRKHMRRGLIPNLFPDRGGEPAYNTVDGTLWFFVAANALADAGQENFVRQELCPSLEESIDWHRRGTDFGIHVDEDQLLVAGDIDTQLTWMDARHDGVPVTPRHGKAVEIGALWINALEIAARFAPETRAVEYRRIANHARQSFHDLHCRPDCEYLCDVVSQLGGKWVHDWSVRPNQVIALALPFEVVTRSCAERVLRTVRSKLFTPRGLRTLDPDDPRYRGHYEGPAHEREPAYHQGTVWPWLFGPYAKALKRYGDPAAKAELRAVGQQLVGLADAGVGSIAEIFDGDAPHLARGALFQAWSVAALIEILGLDD